MPAITSSGGLGKGTLAIKVDTREIAKVGQALSEVGLAVRERVLYRALNRTGDMATTQVKRTLAKETGLKVSRIGQALKKTRARPGFLTYAIDARGGFLKITTGNFGARQVRAGVSHKAWNRRQTAKGAFMVGRVAFKRLGRARLPIRALYGPAIPREMVRGHSEQVIQGMVATVFIPRTLHEIDRELKKAKARHGL